MPDALLRRLCAAVLMFCVWGTAAAAPDVAFYEMEVRPILQQHCLRCHGGEGKPKGGLSLLSRDLILKGGDLGPAVDLKSPDKSLLIKAVLYTDEDLKMPPKQKLPAEQIATLRKWVAMGMPMPVTAAPQPQHADEAPVVDDKARKFWSFVKPVRPEVPKVQRKDWIASDIDAFILAKLEGKGLAPAPPAEKTALLRRAYYDLIGLPPTPAQVEAFLADPRPAAFSRVIEELLASPHYGEKLGRHWLDLVRFAETNSYERDNPKPNAWRYRDYVIRSFNADKPYDQFLKEQLAGDEMPDAPQNPERIIATGYYRLGIWDDEPVDREQAKYDSLDDIVATTSQVMLGLTMDCARCHDHKIDPLPQRDYYRMLAFFQNVNHYKNGGPTDLRPIFASAQDRDAAEQRHIERKKQLSAVEQEVREAEEIFHQLLTGEPGKSDIKLSEAKRLLSKEGPRVLGQARYDDYRALRKKLEDLRKPDAEVDLALCVSERGPTAPPTHVLIRGSAAAPGAQVQPGFPEVLGFADPVIPPPAKDAQTSGRRSVLAGWIASGDNPLAARVMVNRIWQYHFGRGIVRSANDFGFKGDAPTHPELLDYLAHRFVEGGWSIKAMHRLIMNSSAYRMSSRTDARALELDPQNNLFWRFDLRRLTAEEIRDSILLVNGTLNGRMFGPSVYPPIPREVMAGQSVPGKGWHTSSPEESARRSIYIHVKRSLRVPIIEAFDGAETDRSCPVRFVTVQPTQALGMINSAFMQQEAQKLAERLRKEAGADVRRQVALALRLTISRTPAEGEIARGLKLIEDLQKRDGASPEQALRYFCLMALNLNEFVYLD